MAIKNSQNGPTSQEATPVEIREVIGRVMIFARELLQDGGTPRDVVFALKTVAEDMGLNLTDDALEIIPLLRSPIAIQAERRVETPEAPETESGNADSAKLPPKGATVH